MRVLYYNWADYRDAEGRGGGVSVYQRNVIDGLSTREGVETAFLSSGLAHDLRGGAPRVVQVEGGKSPRYCLVNSGLVAPSHADFGGSAQLDHPPTEAAFARFVDQTGPWDVIHFNNLEGLPAHVLALKDRWPNTRFVLSLHNYYPFCPQVNLWYAEADTCTDYDDGARCGTCLTARPEPRSVRMAYAVGWTLSRFRAGPGTPLFDNLFRPALGLAWRSARRVMRMRHARRAAQTGTDLSARAHTLHAPDGQPFAQRRARMVALINTHVDAVLCVSDRVRQIAAHHGIDPARLQTCYIGSREAQEWHRTQPGDSFLQPDGTVRLAYLGYMRRDKGFHFLMRALAALPHDVAQRVRLTVAARNGEPEAMQLMQAVSAHLGELRHIDGFGHDDLDGLLADVNLGLVPVVWEDNLPQVAIEMHARHIPLLTSDRGGAQELGNCPDLVFRAGDAQDFARVLDRVLQQTLLPAHYWASAKPPVEMPAHLDALLSVYQERP